MRWHNEYNVGTLMRPGAAAFKTPDEAVDLTAFSDGAASVIGTPDDLVQSIRSILELSGGFGTVIGFAHDRGQATGENINFSSARPGRRYVIPGHPPSKAIAPCASTWSSTRESFERAARRS